MIKLIFGLIFTCMLAGCGDNSFWDSSCESEMNKIKGQRGAPEEVKTYNSGDYSSTDWWYWSKGISYTFTYNQSCSISTYEFKPIK